MRDTSYSFFLFLLKIQQTQIMKIEPLVIQHSSDVTLQSDLKRQGHKIKRWNTI